MTTWFDCEIADCLPNLKLSFYLSSYSERKFLHKLDIARDFEMSNLIKKKLARQCIEITNLKPNTIVNRAQKNTWPLQNSLISSGVADSPACNLENKTNNYNSITLKLLE